MMRGVWLEEHKLLYRDDIPVPKTPPGEALVRVTLAGVCSTDLELVKGYYPYTGILGHEFVGVIVDAKDAPHRIGERVVGEINAVCGQCSSCRNGRPTHCEHRTVLGIANRHGAFADYLTLPLENLVLVPSNVSDLQAVFTEPLAAALEIQQQVHIRPTDRVLVIGAGRLGQLVSWTLALTGCNLSVVVRHERQRTLLRSLGIHTCSLDELKLRSFDLVVEATGSEAGFLQAVKLVRPRGAIVLKSTYRGTVEVNFSQIVVDEITLVGSRCGPFEPALNLLASGQISPETLIDDRYPIYQAIAAFSRAAGQGVFKVLLEMGAVS